MIMEAMMLARQTRKHQIEWCNFFSLSPSHVWLIFVCNYGIQWFKVAQECHRDPLIMKDVAACNISSDLLSFFVLFGHLLPSPFLFIEKHIFTSLPHIHLNSYMLLQFKIIGFAAQSVYKVKPFYKHALDLGNICMIILTCCNLQYLVPQSESKQILLVLCLLKVEQVYICFSAGA